MLTQVSHNAQPFKSCSARRFRFMPCRTSNRKPVLYNRCAMISQVQRSRCDKINGGYWFIHSPQPESRSISISRHIVSYWQSTEGLPCSSHATISKRAQGPKHSTGLGSVLTPLGSPISELSTTRSRHVFEVLRTRTRTKSRKRGRVARS
jgi:hypothetical protein